MEGMRLVVMDMSTVRYVGTDEGNDRDMQEEVEMMECGGGGVVVMEVMMEMSQV